LAIFTMVPANMSALVYAEPHEMWFRVAGSFAAPLFILLSGMMVSTNSVGKGYDLKYYLIRCGMLLSVAALIDVLVWHVIPFMTWDVLYVISFAMPIGYLFFKIEKAWLRWLIILAIFAAAPLLQSVLGYADYPTEISLWGEQLELPENETNVLNHLLVDGWFPLFPWLAFGLLGGELARLRKVVDGCRTLGKWALPLGLGLLAVGIAIWWTWPGPMLTREGYSELFYPPTYGFMVTTVGVIVTAFSLIDLCADWAGFQPLRVLGEAALFMYIVH
jgi:uncharacterized membrane protein